MRAIVREVTRNRIDRIAGNTSDNRDTYRIVHLDNEGTQFHMYQKRSLWLTFANSADVGGLGATM